MTVFALCVEPGAAAPGMVAGLASRLGLKLFDQRTFELAVAARSDFSDRKLHSYSSGTPLPAALRDIRIEQLASRIREEVLEVVAAGNALIVGWSAIPILRPFEHVPRVLLRAPDRFRHSATMRQFGYQHIGTAQLEVDSTDGLIGRFLQRLYGCDWRAPDNFDLVVDSSRVPARLQLDLVELLVGNATFQDTPEVRTRVAAALDMLRLHEALHPGEGPQPDVEPVPPRPATNASRRYAQ
ncbi:MAG: AAA family ATPase [Hyphomicrobiaceae bacterium]